MTRSPKIAFLLDVDNTLFDNDRFGADLSERLDEAFGPAHRDRYWSIYHSLRDECGFADYLGAMQKFRIGLEEDTDILEVASFVLDYPFALNLYPAALEVVAHLRRSGLTAILSDGDIVLQPRKIRHSGIWDAVEGRVLVCLHKERALEPMQRRFPASHYVMVDDKPNLLAAMKRTLGAKLTTIFVRQGHYATDPANASIDPPPDHVIERISDLLKYDATHLLAVAANDDGKLEFR